MELTSVGAEYAGLMWCRKIKLQVDAYLWGLWYIITYKEMNIYWQNLSSGIKYAICS